MARPVDPNAQYTVKPHKTKGYTYASTQPPYTDPKTGKKKYRYIHWGSVDENLKFIPGKPFILSRRARAINFSRRLGHERSRDAHGATRVKVR